MSEPVFPLRGQDALAPETIAFYEGLCRARPELQEQAVEVGSALAEFLQWQADNRSRVKLPDHKHVPVDSPHAAAPLQRMNSALRLRQSRGFTFVQISDVLAMLDGDFSVVAEGRWGSTVDPAVFAVEREGSWPEPADVATGALDPDDVVVIAANSLQEDDAATLAFAKPACPSCGGSWTASGVVWAKTCQDQWHVDNFPSPAKKE